MTHFFIAKENILDRQVTKQTNLLTRYLNSIDWDSLFSKIVTTTVLIIFISFIFLIVNSIGKKIIDRSFNHAHKVTIMEQSKAETIHTLLRNIFHYAMVFLYVYAVLSTLGVPIATLVAGASIFSVAIGLGAQGFITDMITGGFILLEQQLSVGDEVKIGTVSGTVYAVGLRTTQVLDYDGTMHYIPNRNITIVSNLSRNDMRALVTIPLDTTQSITDMEKVLEGVNAKLAKTFAKDITKGPTLLGAVDAGNGRLTYQVLIYTKNGAQYNIQRTYLAHYLEALQQAGFKIPAVATPSAPK